MINGSRVDTFCEQIFKPVEHYISSQCESLNAMNFGISSFIQAIKAKQGQKIPIQESDPQASTKVESESAATLQNADHSSNKNQSDLNSSVERIFLSYM